LLLTLLSTAKDDATELLVTEVKDVTSEESPPVWRTASITGGPPPLLLAVFRMLSTPWSVLSGLAAVQSPSGSRAATLAVFFTKVNFLAGLDGGTRLAETILSLLTGWLM
jgi:hypothetical protein